MEDIIYGVYLSVQNDQMNMFSDKFSNWLDFSNHSYTGGMPVVAISTGRM